jgi:hypothetical protein
MLFERRNQFLNGPGGVDGPGGRRADADLPSQMKR